MIQISTVEECLDAIEEIRIFLQRASGKSLMPVESVKSDSISDDYLEEFTDLRSLLNSTRWPYAVNPQYICSKNSESDKIDRANGILETVVNKSVHNLRFLDFGCGEGHVVAQAAIQKPAIAVGYDIVDSFSSLGKSRGIHLTINQDELIGFKPFDVILMNDVLDHVEDDPVSVMSFARDLLTDDGSLIVRFHPWCSRHGSHLYQDRNKAFFHLVFTEDELQKLGLSLPPMQRVTNPKKIYPSWIKKAGLQVVKEDVSVMRVEDFFTDADLVRARINQAMGRGNSHDIPISQMEQCFVDYILQKR